MMILPDELIQHIYSFIPTRWMKLCNKEFSALYFSNPRRNHMCAWYRLQKKIFELQETIKRKKNSLEKLDGRKRFRDFRDVDVHLESREELMMELKWARQDVDSIHKQQMRLASRGCLSSGRLKERWNRRMERSLSS